VEESPRDEFDRSWQPRLWFTLGVLILIGAYVIAFVVGNDEEASVDFVFAKATTSLIWVILLSLLAGLVGGVLLSQLHRRRQRRNEARMETPSPISDGEAKLNASRAEDAPPSPPE
jgi:uncharacterized integral membrane protein